MKVARVVQAGGRRKRLPTRGNLADGLPVSSSTTWAEEVLKEVAAHSACWAKAGPPILDGKRAATTRERWQQVHDMLDRGLGLLECTRRLNLALNTVKRYARVSEPERVVRAPQYRPTLVDPYRDHLRARRARTPPFRCCNCSKRSKPWDTPEARTWLYRYITQGRVRPTSHDSPRAALPGYCCPIPTACQIRTGT